MYSVYKPACSHVGLDLQASGSGDSYDVASLDLVYMHVLSYSNF